MGNKIGVSVAKGLDVPNFVNDVPNFVKNVPRLPKFVLRWEEFPNEEMDHGKRDKCLVSSRIGCIKISQ